VRWLARGEVELPTHDDRLAPAELDHAGSVRFTKRRRESPVCTTELGVLARMKQEFDQRDVKVIGLSVDNVTDHERWALDIADTQGHALNFPLIADPDRAVSELYGMIHPNASETTTVRSVFLIGPDKKVKLTLTYPMSTGRDFGEILRAVDSLQPTASHKVGTPANRRRGNDVTSLASVSDDEARERFPGGWRAPKPYLRIVAPPP
jgi:alkyl hydroperoxide reductase subunit AhpC